MVLQPENIPTAPLPTACQDGLSLGQWYAEPLTRVAASDLQRHTRRTLHQACLTGADSFSARLQQLVAGFWLGHTSEACHATLAATTSDACRHALLDLVYGQLLVSCKLADAHTWLHSGFVRAAKLLSAADYFRVMKRHTLLRYLVLCETASAPLGLESLLEEARVIRRLTDAKVERSVPSHSPQDTLG